MGGGKIRIQQGEDQSWTVCCRYERVVAGRLTCSLLPFPLTAHNSCCIYPSLLPNCVLESCADSVQRSSLEQLEHEPRSIVPWSELCRIGTCTCTPALSSYFKPSWHTVISSSSQQQQNWTPDICYNSWLAVGFGWIDVAAFEIYAS